MTLAEALQRPRTADHSSNQLQQQISLAAPRTMQSSANQVSTANQQARLGHADKCQRQRRGRNADNKQRYTCANCDQRGHWYAACTVTTDMEQKPELVQHLKKKKAKKQEVSLINSMCRVHTMPTTGEPRRLFENLALSSSHTSKRSNWRNL